MKAGVSALVSMIRSIATSLALDVTFISYLTTCILNIIGLEKYNEKPIFTIILIRIFFKIILFLRGTRTPVHSSRQRGGGYRIYRSIFGSCVCFMLQQNKRRMRENRKKIFFWWTQKPSLGYQTNTKGNVKIEKAKNKNTAQQTNVTKCLLYETDENFKCRIYKYFFVCARFFYIPVWNVYISSHSKCLDRKTVSFLVLLFVCCFFFFACLAWKLCLTIYMFNQFFSWCRTWCSRI